MYRETKCGWAAGEINKGTKTGLDVFKHLNLCNLSRLASRIVNAYDTTSHPSIHHHSRAENPAD